MAQLRALVGVACGVLAFASRPVAQVHLALGTDETRMNVEWYSEPGDILGDGSSVVQWGSAPTKLTFSANGTNVTMTDPDTARVYTFNVATITGLVPGATVFYRVGNPLDGWSSVYSFVATRTDFSDVPLRVGVFGDLGWQNAQALAYLQSEAASGNFDFVIHVGDFAYNLEDNNGTVGDEFMDSIVPIASTTPYMTCPGNHEGGQNFLQYLNRFTSQPTNTGLTQGMSGLTGGLPNVMYFSWNAGLVHFVALSTEAYFFYDGAAAQYAWLESDLTAVNRTATPWVFVYGHRSIYCSCDSDCDADATTVRDGANGLEALFIRYGVDVWINGHEHNYERNYPTYKSKLVTRGSGGLPDRVSNPGAPVYIVSGCAGDVERHEPFTRAQPDYSAFRSNTYGYSRLTVYNASTLLWEQVMTDNEYNNTGSVIDAMLLVSPTHGPFHP